MAITVKLACVLFACMMVSAPYAEAAITCVSVLTSLNPCLPYIQAGGSPSGSCCGAVKALNSKARTTPDRRLICGCLKVAASSLRGSAKNVPSLPGKCGVSIPYKFSPNTDCNKIK